MINVSAASIVTAHHNADDCRSIGCNSAEPRIALHKLGDPFFVVAFGNLQTFDSVPEQKRGVVIVGRKLPSHDLFAHLVFTILEFIAVMSSEVACQAVALCEGCRHPTKLLV